VGLCGSLANIWKIRRSCEKLDRAGPAPHRSRFGTRPVELLAGYSVNLELLPARQAYARLDETLIYLDIERGREQDVIMT
jgi:hypothetical protein